MSWFDKLWFQKNQNQIALNRAEELIRKTGFALPCKVESVSGQLVTVSFEVDSSPWQLPQITIPKAEGPYTFNPVQIGDYGVTLSADVYLGGITGLGGGLADWTRRGNLNSTLFWVPLGNIYFQPENQNIGQSLGPDGWEIGQKGGYTLFANSTGTGASNGATGTFSNSSGNTLTIVNGIVTQIT